VCEVEATSRLETGGDTKEPVQDYFIHDIVIPALQAHLMEMQDSEAFTPPHIEDEKTDVPVTASALSGESSKIATPGPSAAAKFPSPDNGVAYEEFAIEQNLAGRRRKESVPEAVRESELRRFPSEEDTTVVVENRKSVLSSAIFDICSSQKDKTTGDSTSVGEIDSCPNEQVSTRFEESGPVIVEAEIQGNEEGSSLDIPFGGLAQASIVPSSSVLGNQNVVSHINSEFVSDQTLSDGEDRHAARSPPAPDGSKKGTGEDNDSHKPALVVKELCRRSWSPPKRRSPKRVNVHRGLKNGRASGRSD
jgi:hypothetical protein